MGTLYIQVKVPEEVLGLVEKEAKEVYVRSRPELKGCSIPRWVIIKRALEFYVNPLPLGGKR